MIPRFMIPAALALPLIGLVVAAILPWRDERNSVAWDVPITGYDPRDILRGHYVMFRYAWPDTATGTMPGDMPESSWRVCFNGERTQPTITFFSDDAPAPSCVSIGRSIEDHDGLTFRANVRDTGRPVAQGRMFIPEDDGPALNRILADSTADVRARILVSPSGRVTPIDILIGGKPYRESLGGQEEPR